MVLRRTGERRRRVVMDEALQSTAAVVDPAASPEGEEPVKARRSRQYSRHADRRNLPRCTDFVPVSRWAVLAAWCICLGILLALNLGFGFVGARPNPAFPRLSEAFGFGPRSVGSWLQVLAWGLAGVCSLMIYSIRQHRSNDFRGTYRLWRWVALACWCLSLAVLVDLWGIAAELLAWFTGEVYAADSLLLLTAQSCAVLGLAVRVLFELRHSRAAVAAAAAAAATGLAACWLRREAWGESLASNWEFVAANLGLWSTALTLMCLIIYARFVVLHSSGAIQVTERIPGRKGKAKRSRLRGKPNAGRKGQRPRAAGEGRNGRSNRDDGETEGAEEQLDRADEDRRPDSSRPGRASNGRELPAESEVEDGDEADSAEDAGAGRLSRAERKRMKREQRQGRRAA